MLNAIFRRLFAHPSGESGQGDDSETASAVYASIVAQARQPAFYTEFGVPDTPTGRFQMIVVHATLVFRRLKGSPELEAAGQDVFDLFFADMDRSLRELGVGDLSVPKQIKRMGQAFYGHAGAYAKALDAGDVDALGDAVAGNVLATADKTPHLQDHARSIAGYMMACDGYLRDEDIGAILEGRIAWPAVEAGKKRSVS